MYFLKIQYLLDIRQLLDRIDLSEDDFLPGINHNISPFGKAVLLAENI